MNNSGKQSPLRGQANSGGVLWYLDDPSQPAKLERGRNESARANRALRAYLLLPPAERSLAALAAQHPAHQLRAWMKRYAWEERARHFDELRSQNERQENAERQRRILQEGPATSLERVDELKQMYAVLKRELQRDEHVWLVEVKYQRVEDNQYERIENLRFNAALFNLARGVLADLARETGGRMLRAEINATPDPADETARPRLDFSGLSKLELDAMEKVMRNMGLDHELFP